MINKTNRMIAALTGLSIAATAAAATEAVAHMPSDPASVGDVAKLSRESNLIMQGKVKSVSYRNHIVGGHDMPFSYVTYTVTSRLLGTSKPEITLRFIGGPNGQGGYVSAEGVPSFSPGDEDILFVKSNGDTGCPLVMCEFGRFRLLNGTVYEAHGQAVQALSNGKLRSGGAFAPAFSTIKYPAPSFDDVIKNPRVLARIKQMGLSLEQARAKYNRETAKEIVIETHESGDGGAASPAAAAPAMNTAAVLTAIRSAVASQRRALPAPIADADPATFNAPASTAAVSPK